ncbi:MAG: DUF4105 domain-containing protein [Polyangiaceae bacterium]|nr:DUF4105 domain-containing protein [Polyangiaceae bacterium]
MISTNRAVRVALALVFLLALAVAWPQGESHAQTEAPRTPVTGEAPGDAPPFPQPAGKGRRAPVPSAPVSPEERLKVYVLTFTPGDHPFYKFGHNAIWIHDESSRELYKRDLVYNYGMFSFGDPALIPKFFLGRFLYWLEPHPLAGTIRGYQREGRGVIAQELDLTMEQEVELKRLLEENALKENKYYKYDYYRDNCSTRVRDMIDRVTGGNIRAITSGPARLNWRQHTSRLTSDLLSEYVILNLVMGDLIDKPRTVWEESFIPMEFQKVLRSAKVVGEDGVERPLVKEERVLVEALKPPPPDDPPVRWPYSLLFGLLFGGLFAGAGRAGMRAAPFRAIYGVVLSLAGLVCGFFGVFFLAAWAFTDHEVGYRNENVLLCVPWAFGLVGMGINVARNRAVSIVRARKLVMLALGSTTFALVVKVLPWFDQDNWLFLPFFLPFWAGAFYGIDQLSKRALAAVAAVKADGPAANGDQTSPQKKKKKRTEEEAVVAGEAADTDPKDTKDAEAPVAPPPHEAPHDPPPHGETAEPAADGGRE